MTNSIIKEVLPYDINKVWSVIRNIEAYPQWRSDVFNVEILDSTRFIEYGKNAFPTTSVSISYPLIKHKWFSKLQAKTLGVPADHLLETYYESSIQISKESLSRMLLENAAFMPASSIKETNALVIVGSEERRIMRRSARKLNEMIEGSKLRTLPGYKHGELSLRHPEEYVALLVQMIDGNSEQITYGGCEI